MGKTLKERREALDITQMEAAKRIGVSLSSYRMWEYEVSKPNEENQKKLDKVLGKEE